MSSTEHSTTDSLEGNKSGSSTPICSQSSLTSLQSQISLIGTLQSPSEHSAVAETYSGDITLTECDMDKQNVPDVIPSVRKKIIMSQREETAL